MCAVRVCLLLLAVVAMVAVTEAMFPFLKQQKKDAFERYAKQVKEKKSVSEKRDRGSGEQGCPLYDCYEEVTWAMQMESCRAMSDCSTEKMDNNICGCSLNDVLWAEGQLQTGWLCDDSDEASSEEDGCNECLGKMSELWDDTGLPFSCKEGDVADAEDCFGGLGDDNTCLDDALGQPVRQKEFFQSLRLQIDGCPLTPIIMDCMQTGYSAYYNPYAGCVLMRENLPENIQCVRDRVAGVDECEVSEEVMGAIDAGLTEYYQKVCDGVEQAKLKLKDCCGSKRSADTLQNDVLQADGLLDDGLEVDGLQAVGLKDEHLQADSVQADAADDDILQANFLARLKKVLKKKGIY